MPKFTVEHAHALPAPEIRKRLDTLSDTLSSKYGIDARWKSDTEAVFKRTGATGFIHCHPDKVVVHVDLSMLLGPMKDKIEGRIRSELAKALT